MAIVLTISVLRESAASARFNIGVENNMKVTQVVNGRFHHFHLARQLNARGLLREIWTGYPRFKLASEGGIEANKIRCYSRLYVPYLLAQRISWLRDSERLMESLQWHSHARLDAVAATSIREPTILVGLSGAGLVAGRKAQSLGGRYICDRGSSHIGYQRDLLVDEHQRWGAEPPRFSSRIIDKEFEEYRVSDAITVPSTFVLNSFLERGVPREKLRLIPYGARLERFHPQGGPDPDRFTLLFVGRVTLRKGFPYLLEAFKRLKHPRKRLLVAGRPDAVMERLLGRFDSDHVEYIGHVPNHALAQYYSSADALVLPSIEEGLAMVMGEAMACGCPVIATPNTGAGDLFTSGIEGLTVPIRDVDKLVDAMTTLADDKASVQAMRNAALERVRRIGGWDSYGENWAALIEELKMAPGSMGRG